MSTGVPVYVFGYVREGAGLERVQARRHEHERAQAARVQRGLAQRAQPRLRHRHVPHRRL